MKLVAYQFEDGRVVFAEMSGEEERMVKASIRLAEPEDFGEVDPCYAFGEQLLEMLGREVRTVQPKEMKKIGGKFFLIE